MNIRRLIAPVVISLVAWVALYFTLARPLLDLAGHMGGGVTP